MAYGFLDPLISCTPKCKGRDVMMSKVGHLGLMLFLTLALHY